MKVLYDLTSTQPSGSMKVNGGGEYSYTIFKNIIENKRENEIIGLVCDKYDNNEDVIDLCKKYNIKLIRYSNCEELEKVVIKENVERVVFPVCYARYHSLNLPKDIEVIAVIHDLCDLYYYGKANVKYGRFMKNDGLNMLRLAKQKVIRKQKEEEFIKKHNKLLHLSSNERVITVSHFSRTTIRYFLDAKDVNIDVFYTVPKIFNGCNNVDTNSILNRYGVEKNKFFLLMAGCRWAKNNAIVLKAIDYLFSMHMLSNEYKVIVLGNDAISKKYYNSIVTNKERFVFDGYVENMELDVLYRNTFLFLFPSVIEGFGMPPLEAMERGALVACSTAMSIPEVCGSGATYFDPYNIESITVAILKHFEHDYKLYMSENAHRWIEFINKKREEDMQSIMDLILG